MGRPHAVRALVCAGADILRENIVGNTALDDIALGPGREDYPGDWTHGALDTKQIVMSLARAPAATARSWWWPRKSKRASEAVKEIAAMRRRRASAAAGKAGKAGALSSVVMRWGAERWSKERRMRVVTRGLLR